MVTVYSTLSLHQLKMMRSLVVQVGNSTFRRHVFRMAPVSSSSHPLAPFIGCIQSGAFGTMASVTHQEPRALAVQCCGGTLPLQLGVRSLWTQTELLLPAAGPGLVPQRSMAGHSKWHNIRHIKGAKDAEKAKVAASFSKKISACIRETGSADPKFNVQLARLVADAKAKDVPNSTIEGAIRQGVLDKQNSSQEYFDIKGPGGIMMVLETLTAKRELTKNNLKGVLKKHGFSVESTGALRHCFSTKGVVLVACQETPNLDAFVDVAIDVGAEDVTVDENEDGETVLKFTCEADDLYSVKKALLEQNLPVESQEVVFIPTSPVYPGEEFLEAFEKVMEKLEEIVPEVVHVYTNIGKDESRG